MNGKKIAIVGYSPSSRDLAPYQNKTWEIWSVNEGYQICPRVDVLFELHEYKWLQSKVRNPKHLEALQKSTIPIFMLEHYEDIPHSVRYPIEEIKKTFYPFGYFTNSIAYMIALAIYLKVDEIAIYGIDMATTVEYVHQRGSVEFWVGIAIGKGIKITIPAQSDICKAQYLYGYQDNEITQMALKATARKNELRARADDYRRKAEENLTYMNQMMGALDDCEYWARCWQPSNNDLHDGIDNVKPIEIATPKIKKPKKAKKIKTVEKSTEG